jgi:hypothetical protein
MPKDGSFSNRNESQKERLRFVPAPMVGLGRTVSRVEMNAKYAPLTPSFPNRRYPMLFLKPKAPKRALTKPTLSYMGHPAPGRIGEWTVEVCAIPPFRDKTAEGWGTRPPGLNLVQEAGEELWIPRPESGIWGARHPAPGDKRLDRSFMRGLTPPPPSKSSFSAASKARIPFIAFTARLNSCPFKTST